MYMGNLKVQNERFSNMNDESHWNLKEIHISIVVGRIINGMTLFSWMPFPHYLGTSTTTESCNYRKPPGQRILNWLGFCSSRNFPYNHGT
jgi:hypothetical protein